MNRYITIGLSWPYANNNLHIGHLSSSVPADVLARYHRSAGDNVMFVSGTDAHGTKPELVAKKEGKTPKEVVDRYHKNFVESFNAYDFTFDKYGITYEEYHKARVKELVEKMYKNGHIVPRTEKRPFCPNCNKFVVDTEIKFLCPQCGKESKADSCDCGYVPNEKDLENSQCLICGGNTVQKDNNVLVFKITHFKKELEKHLKKNGLNWRANAVNETSKYLKDLQDRDFSRDLSWGIDIPIDGFRDKKIYVWFEALLGYVTDTMSVAADRGLNFEDFWKKDSKTQKRIYMVHAKDNIPFHTIIFPAILLALEENWALPDWIVSGEYLTQNDAKISKSTSTGLTDAIKYLDSFSSDTIRYYFVVNGPEKKDANFSEELVAVVHNTELVNKLGNLVNRTLRFKNLQVLPDGKLIKEIEDEVKRTYVEVAEYIESIEIKKAGKRVMELVEFANKFYDEQKPWIKFKEDKEAFDNIIFSCAYIIANLSNLLEPFMPKTAQKIRQMMDLKNKAVWNAVDIKSGINLLDIKPLFERV